MANATVLGVGVGVLSLCWVAQGQPRAEQGPSPAPDKWQLVQSFTRAHPGARIAKRSGRVTRVYGRAFSSGASAQQSADSFIQNHVAMLGAQPRHITPLADAHVQPVMYLPETGGYKFTRYAYQQEVDGVPVFRSALRLLVRNEPGYPLVLASVDLRDLGDFQVPEVDPAVPAASTQAAMAHAQAMSSLAGDPQVLFTRRVIWAGVEDMNVEPRLADEILVGVDLDRWLVLTDVQTGEVLYEEQRVHMMDVTGDVSGLATGGIGTDVCEPEVPMVLPYVKVQSGNESTYTAADGTFVLPNAGTQPITVLATLNGQWFDVYNYFVQNPAVATVQVTPPGPAQLVFNAANTDEQTRAQVNAYVYANMTRDFVLNYNPAYPDLDVGNFPVWVNRPPGNGFCPANAWFNHGWPSGPSPSINFCLSAAIWPNTAWSAVIMHEYGHHLIDVGGSGQCQYGEGMADTIYVVMVDDPRIGMGFFGACNEPLRSADQDCQYDVATCSSCGFPCHDCGQLLSSTVWSIRNLLVQSEPDDYGDILASIVLNSILVHTGTLISSDIATDFLTLDDDDDNICNGTPHISEIVEGFADHGLFEMENHFYYPNGRPQMIDLVGGSTVDVLVDFEGQPGTGVMHVDTGGGFTAIPMDQSAPNNYEAEFPSADCGSLVPYYFSVEAMSGGTITDPPDAPASTFSAISTDPTSVEVLFEDDFETDQGWTVSSDSADGPWERGTPISNAICDRGNPGEDADGSGQCYLTDNDGGNACNSDVDTGWTTLTSPVMDASGADIFVSYWRWFNNMEGAGPFQDLFVIEVSDGGPWVTLETVGPACNEAAGGWVQRSFRVADFVTPNDQFQIRFTASDSDPQSIVEAGVDGVELLGVLCPLVPGDVDGDLVVGIEDFLAVLGNWGPCGEACPPSCLADLDGDCIVGIGDFLIVLGNWTL